MGTASHGLNVHKNAILGLPKEPQAETLKVERILRGIKMQRVLRAAALFLGTIILSALWVVGCQESRKTTIHIYDLDAQEYTIRTQSRVCDDGIGDVCFVAFGDAGKGNEGQYQVAEAIRKKCEFDGCQFALQLGDNFYPTGVDSVDDPQWIEKFEKPYQSLWFPHYVVFGNHDYGSLGNTFAKGEHQLKYSRKNPKWILPDHFYDFLFGHVHFLALDTAMAFWNQGTIIEDQIRFVKNRIAEVSADWRILFGHHPYLSNGPHGNAGSYEDKPWLPIANGRFVKELLNKTVCQDADLYLSGHDHSLQVLPGPTECPTLLVVSGGGASTTALKKRNLALFESRQMGFTYIAISGKTLFLEKVNENAETIFAMELRK